MGLKLISYVSLAGLAQWMGRRGKGLTAVFTDPYEWDAGCYLNDSQFAF